MEFMLSNGGRRLYFTCSMTELGQFYGTETANQVKKKLNTLSRTSYQACIANTTMPELSKVLVKAGMKLVGKYLGNSSGLNSVVYTHLWIKPKRIRK